MRSFHPVRIHRQWFLMGAGSLAFLVAGSALGVSAIEKSSRGPAYHLSTSCLRVNARARKMLGVVTGYSLPSGPVQENADGTGSANLQFDVIGSWHTGRAHVKAVEQGSVWYWTGEGGTIDVAGKRYRVNLEQVHTIRRARPRYSVLCAPPISTTTFHPS
ncbi:MAG: cytochrome c oxidase assembly factor Coa1 family protein [Gaiellales bacterium]